MMAILSFIPAFIIHLLLIGGTIGFIASLILEMFPLVAKYKIIIQFISVICIVAGAWGAGANFIKSENDKEISLLKLRVAEAEKKGSEATTKIEYVYQDKIQKVKDVQVVVQEKIRDISVKIDSECKVSAEAINVLNAAAANKTKGLK